MQTAPELTAILLRSLVLLRSMLFTKYILLFCFTLANVREVFVVCKKNFEVRL